MFNSNSQERVSGPQCKLVLRLLLYIGFGMLAVLGVATLTCPKEVRAARRLTKYRKPQDRAILVKIMKAKSIATANVLTNMVDNPAKFKKYLAKEYDSFYDKKKGWVDTLDEFDYSFDAEDWEF